MKLLRSERTSTRFGKNLPIIGSEMWYVFVFSSKIVVIVVQSGLKLYDLTVIAAGVQANEFVIAPFAYNADNGAIMCLFDRTEDRI